jgi:hypothetical protein
MQAHLRSFYRLRVSRRGVSECALPERAKSLKHCGLKRLAGGPKATEIGRLLAFNWREKPTQKVEVGEPGFFGDPNERAHPDVNTPHVRPCQPADRVRGSEAPLKMDHE